MRKIKNWLAKFHPSGLVDKDYFNKFSRIAFNISEQGYMHMLDFPVDTTCFVLTKDDIGKYTLTSPTAIIPSISAVTIAAHAETDLGLATNPIVFCSLYCPGGGPGAFETLRIWFKDVDNNFVDPTPMSNKKFYVDFPFFTHPNSVYFNT